MTITDPAEILNTRGCFTILAVSLKTDYNKRLRAVCEKIHGNVVKQRCSRNNHEEKEFRRRSDFKFTNDMVVKKIEVQGMVVPSELLKLREENEQLENKIVVLKQSNQNMTTSTNDEEELMCANDDETQEVKSIQDCEDDVTPNIVSVEDDETSKN